MERHCLPVLVIFDIDLSKSTYDDLCERLSELGVVNAHKLGLRAMVKSSKEMMLIEIWPSRSFEVAFRNNILPLMEAMGVRVNYNIYPIRNTGKSDREIIPPSTRWMLYN